MEIVGDVVERFSFSDEFVQSEAVCTDGDNFFLVTSSRYEVEITSDNIDELPRVLIPSYHFQPPFDAQKHSLAPRRALQSCYVKVPVLTRYNAKDQWKLLRLVLHEAEVCEVLKLSPHPNVAQYYGCKVKDNRIAGLCFERYGETLYERANCLKAEEDKRKCLDEILSGIKHLHALGCCHNDINPSNVMFREDGTAVIIDFDSCQRTRHILGEKKGTAGYFDKRVTMSEEKNDIYSLDKIRQFLDNGE